MSAIDTLHDDHDFYVVLEDGATYSGITGATVQLAPKGMDPELVEQAIYGKQLEQEIVLCRSDVLAAAKTLIDEGASEEATRAYVELCNEISVREDFAIEITAAQLGVEL